MHNLPLYIVELLKSTITWCNIKLVLMTAEPAVAAFIAQRIVPRETCHYGGDGGRIYGVHVMREGVFDSRIVSPWN